MVVAFAFGGMIACSSAREASGVDSAAGGDAAPVEDADAAAPDAAIADAGRDATLPPNGSRGCGTRGALAKPGPSSGLVVDVGGKKRTYALSVPPTYDEYRAYPLVFNFHSGGRTGASAREYFGFESFAAAEGVFAYPDGENGSWQLDAPADANTDVAFFDALVSELERALCIDTKRRFATGSSMGAYFVNQLGCRRGDVLRAIAPHAGGGPWETGGDYDERGVLRCKTSPVAAMIFIGLADTNVSPTEGEKSLTHWTAANDCAAATKPAAPSPCVAYDACTRPVVSCKIPGVGHRIWNEGPKATWSFFASF